jgi:hypothetical protein
MCIQERSGIHNYFSFYDKLFCNSYQHALSSSTLRRRHQQERSLQKEKLLMDAKNLTMYLLDSLLKTHAFLL